VRGERYEAGARLRIPFGGGASDDMPAGQWARMAEAIERDTDIVVAGSGSEMVEDAATGTDFDAAAVTAGGSGTIVSDAATALGANGLLILTGGYTDTEAAEIGADQTLLGAGTALQVRGLASGALGTFTYAGERPEIGTGADNSAVELLGDNIHFVGVDMAKPSGFATSTMVTGENLTNLVIDRVGVTGSEARGIEIASGTEARIVGVDVSGTLNAAVEVLANTTVWISESNLTAVNFGVLTGDGNQLTLDDVTLANVSTGLAIQGVGNEVTVNDSRFVGAFGVGIQPTSQENFISGTGNTKAGATFSYAFCDYPDSTTGSLEVDGTIYSVANDNCPDF
jgi:hypothetical protein